MSEGVYRASADPEKDEEIFSLKLSTVKGETLVGMVGGTGIIPLVTAVMLFAEGDDDQTRMVAWISVGLTVFFTALTIFLHRRRSRRLAIIKHGDAMRLTVFPSGPTVTFPITCRGSQIEIRGRMSSYMAHLQLVGREDHAVMLRETRGAVYGPQKNWSLLPVDRNVRSTAFTVGLDMLERVRDTVEKLSRSVGS